VRDHLTTPRAYRRKRGGPEAGDKNVGDFRLFLPLLRRDRAARIHLVPSGARLSGDRSFALASHICRDHGENPAVGARLLERDYSLRVPRVLRRILKTSKIFLKRNVGWQLQVGRPSTTNPYDFRRPPGRRLQTFRNIFSLGYDTSKGDDKLILTFFHFACTATVCTPLDDCSKAQHYV
jgi:hypothetical protein